jgi:hypothetical protein
MAQRPVDVRFAHRGFALARALCGCAPLVATPASALDKWSYSDAAFDEALARGRPVLLQAHRLRPPGTSCPDQWQVVDALAERPDTADALIMLIDTERQPGPLRRFRISLDCTLVAFRDGHETGRRIGTIDPAEIRAMFALAP